MLKKILERVQSNLLNGNHNVSLAFRMFGVSDSSCIDMISYERLGIEQIEKIMRDFNSLANVEGLGPVIEALEQGYANSCVLIVRIKVQPTDLSLPTGLSTLLVGDLGNVNGPLERSIGHLNKIALMMDQPFMNHNSNIQFNSFPLTTLLEPFVGSNSLTCFLVDIQNTNNPKPLIPLLSMTECLRRIKNKPSTNFESNEIKQLKILLSENDRLEKVFLERKGEIRKLKGKIGELAKDKIQLIGKIEWKECGDKVEKWEREYALASLEMESLKVQEHLRECEMELGRKDDFVNS